MRRDRTILLLLIGLIMFSMICTGCGKKDDPMPPMVTLPIIGDLTAHSIREGIELDWSLATPPGEASGFKIVRSETGENDQCAGCPREYHPFKTVTLADDRLTHEEGKRFRYVDADIKTKGQYSYRIAVCNRAGICGEMSNESDTIMAGR